MMVHTLTRPPAPPVDAHDGDHGPLLRLRLSDRATWADKFTAQGAADLRKGCLEAWVACGLEWQRRADLLPAHQTRRRAQVLQGRPRELELQMLDPATASWWSANHATDPMKKLMVREPGTAATDTWEGADWTGAWLRCLRTADAAHRLAVFLNRTVPMMLRDGMDGEGATA